ncbi:MAG: biopolymer transporter ExbD [Verrucomicrobiota bacterium]
MKKPRRSLTRDPEIPVASFVDLAFLLNIFFIMVTSIAEFTGVNADVPSAERSQAVAEQTPTIAIQDNKFTFNDKEISLADLKQRIIDLDLVHKTGEAKVVLLEAQGKIPYQAYFEIMADVSAAGGVIGIVQDEGSQ